MQTRIGWNVLEALGSLVMGGGKTRSTSSEVLVSWDRCLISDADGGSCESKNRGGETWFSGHRVLSGCLAGYSQMQLYPRWLLPLLQEELHWVEGGRGMR